MKPRTRSRQKASAEPESRWPQGRFEREIVPVPIHVKSGMEYVAVDEHPRPGTSPADLARLKPVFREGGSVTAGNSSGINDGAAAVLVVEETRAIRARE